MTLEQEQPWKNSLTGGQPAGRQTLTLPDVGTGWSVALTADRHDELGCLVWEMTLSRATPGGSSLADWANRIAGRVKGLQEPLKVVEVDSLRQEALLRSDEPGQRGDKLFYYEVHLKGTSLATVRRFQALQQPGSRREQVAFALINETLGNLLDDLTAER